MELAVWATFPRTGHKDDFHANPLYPLANTEAHVLVYVVDFCV